MTFIINQKKIPLIAMAALVIIALGIGGAYFFREGHSGTAKVAEGKQLYTCGMHPQVIQDHPGLCPICGMELTPLKKHEHKSESAEKSAATTEPGKGGKAAKDNALLIRVETAVIQKMGVRTEILKKRTISREIRAVAHVDFNEKNQIIINSRVNGWVEKLYARYTGKTVRRGEALAAIYSPDLVSTQEEYLALYRQSRSNPESEELQKLLRAARKRLGYWQITGRQIRKIEESGEVTRRLTLYSPYSGVITEKKVIEGAHIKEGTDLFKIVDLSTVWAYVHIPEKDIPFVESGMRAEMIVPQIPGRVFHGKVSFVFPYMDPQARDLKVRVTFPNHHFQLRPGMYSTIVLKKTLAGKYVVAPTSSIIRTGEREIAFVYRGEGVFEPREVRTGVSAGEAGVQILKGLQEGEAVVVSGQFLLDSESRLQEAVRKMSGDTAGRRATKDSGATGGSGMSGGHGH